MKTMLKKKTQTRKDSIISNPKMLFSYKNRKKINNHNKICSSSNHNNNKINLRGRLKKYLFSFRGRVIVLRIC